ncbi:MAG: protein kinase [Oscillatoria sp. SIO1A7]|nr:protein kinase [Oscillatoria sp. SIO1A7]
MVLSGQILQERYRLQRLLGNSRGSRQTWLAEDLAAEPAAPVAIKLLAFSPKLQWEELKLFEREASVLKHLEHPLIPEYRDYFSLDKEAGDGLPWFGLVQSYIKGSSLQEQLNSGKRFSEEEGKAIAEQILEILIYLHELNPQVLHRDIKPSNIIQSEDNRVYLVDFGSVQERAKAEGATFTVVGTGGYAPPEQLWGRATSASDLYALGATLIHLLTGIFPSELPSRNMRLQFKDKVSLAPGFSAWLEKLVEPAAERRFPEARAARAALKAANSANLNEGKKTKKRASGRGIIGTLTLVQYVAIACFASIFPALFVVRKGPHARNNVGTMNRAQQAYHLDNMNFADRLPRLGIGIPNYTAKYEYFIRRDRGAVFNYAIPRFENLKAYVGGVFVASYDSDDSNSSQIFTAAILCEAKHEGATPPQRPIARGNSVECAPDTKLLSDNLTQLGKDFELGNRSREQADIGQYEAAVKIAASIESDYLKISVLADIASAAIASGQESRGQEIFAEAIEVAMQSKSDRDSALAAIARAMANAGLNEQALEITSKLELLNYRQNALDAIAHSFAKAGDFDRALDIASILKRDAKQKYYDDYDFESSAKAAIARSLADAGQFDRAKKIAANLPKEYRDRVKQYIIVSRARAELEQGNMQ